MPLSDAYRGRLDIVMSALESTEIPTSKGVTQTLPSDDTGNSDIDYEEMFGKDVVEAGKSRITITMDSAKASIVGIHICCAFSRPLLEESGIELSSWPGIISCISWLVYVLFVPGVLILLNRRSGALSNSDFLFILPLSLMWILAVAPSVQILWFFLGIANPIQWWTTAYISLFSTMILYFRYSLRSQNHFSFDLVFERPSHLVVLSCVTMISLSALGPLLINSNGDNSVSMIAIFLVATIPPLVSTSGRFGEYLLLYSTALSALLVCSIVSENVSGLDIQTEYFFANSVLSANSIDIFSGGHYSTVLSTQGIVPLISLWTGIPLTQVLKVIYPVVFSYSAILLLFSYSNLFDSKIPYFAALLTIYSVSFYTSMLDVVRQGFSELFLLSAVAILCSSDSLNMHRNRIFIVPFLISMTLCHYGINYILYPVFWAAYFLFLILSRARPFNYDDQLTTIFKEMDGNIEELEDEEQIPEYLFNQEVLLQEENLFALEDLQNSAREINPLLNAYHLISGTFFLILWHSFAGGGSVIQTVVQYSRTIIPRFLEFGFLGATSRAQPTQFVLRDLEPLHEVTKYLYILIMLLSLPSMYNSLLETDQRRPMRNFLCIAIGAWMMFAFVFLTPNVAVRLHFPRIFHILAIFIFPFSVSTISEKNVLMYLRKIGRESYSPFALPLTRAMLISLFLLSSGFAYQLSDESHRVSLDPELDYARFSESEEAGSIWQDEYAEDSENGLDCKGADFYRARVLKKHNQGQTLESITGLQNAKFVFISGKNIENQEFYLTVVDADNEVEVAGHVPIGEYLSYSDSSSSRIYDSGEAHWYYRGQCTY